MIFRLYGLNWDGGHHLHPDERFLTMVTQDIYWPRSVSSYLNPALSPLNPYNVGYPFFVYGMFPLILVKFISDLITLDHFSYNNITLVGRVLAATFDVGTLLVVYLIARRTFSSRIALFSALFYGLSVLPIQLSHFFTVDPVMVFFLVLSFFLLLIFLDGRRQCFSSIGLGISFGLSVASKISAGYFLAIIGLGWLVVFLRTRKVLPTVLGAVLFVFFSYSTLRLADPRMFTSPSFFDPRPNPQFLANLRELQALNNRFAFFPPSIQWIPTNPIWFPFMNIVLWGFGLPLGIFVVLGLVASLRFFTMTILLPRRIPRILKLWPEHLGHLFLLTWVLFLFISQGIQFVKTLRYFYPIYPFFVILAAWFFDNTVVRRSSHIVVIGFCVIFVIYPVSFLSIYSRPHSRVMASEWIYANIPTGSVLSCEHWDDCLPLGASGRSNALYQTEVLPLFDPDTPEKWRKINRQLENVDYLILSSNRVWGSIPKVPEKFPLTSQFYQDLFAGKLYFKKVFDLTSYPTIPLLNIPIPDDSSEEAFTVYDHPRVIIFQRMQ